MSLAIIFHLLLLFAGTYFISPEISLYPYLVNRGLTPYLNLIDQHFPLIFFGPINLAQLNLVNPAAVFFLFILLTVLTDFLAYLTLKKNLSLFLAFILVSFTLGVRTFWLETFILLFLVSYFYFNKFRPKVSGLFLSLCLAIKPTLLPFIILLIIFNSRSKLRQFLLLPVVPLLQLLWLFYNGLLPAFFQISQFNANTYAPLAASFPHINQILIVALCLVPLFIINFRSLPRLLILILSLAILIYPRFELYHLLPLASLFLLPATFSKTQKKLLILWSAFILIFIFAKKISKPINYYYPESLYQQAAAISKIYNLKSNIYLFGGPDQLYQLTGTLPPGNYYLPSLPWYLANPQFVDRQIDALRSHPDALVVVNRDSRLNDVSLLDYGQPIWQFIQTNYQQIGQVEALEIYARRH